MSVHAGTRAVTDSLVLSIDAENIKSFGGVNYIANSSYRATDWLNVFPANTTITTGIDAPDGTNTAVRVTCSTSGSSLFRINFPAFTPNGTDTYTSSFYARLITPVYGPGTLNTDLHDGASTGYGSQLVANTWVRVEATGIPTATQKAFLDVLSDSTTNAVIDFWGAQVEPSFSATPLTATTGTPKTTRAKTVYDLGDARVSPTLSFVGGAGWSKNPEKFDTNATTVTQQNYLTPSTTIAFTDGSEYSMEFWVKLRSGAQATFHSLCGKLLTAEWVTVQPSDTTGNSWVINYRDAGATYRTSSTITNVNIQNSWTHVGITVDSSRNVRFFVNGTFLNTVTASSTVFTVASIMGGYNSGGNYYPLQGSMALCRLYAKRLSDEEIRSNYNSIRPRFNL